jgi:hypothetical protein
MSFVANFSLSFYRRDEGILHLGPPPIERQTAGERWTLIQTQSNLTSILRNPGARSSDLKG